MKILLLYIYSENQIYNKMIELQREHIINSNIEISYYFIQFRKEQVNLIEIENDFIYVKGQEALLKITEKTLKSLNFLLKDMGLIFDFIIRTNMSTIINLKKLIIFLESIPKNNIYCTGKILKVQHIDNTYGIKNVKLHGTSYASGTSIILSYDVALNMIQDINKFNHDIVDDVSIAIFIKKFIPIAYENLEKYKPSFLIMYNNVDLTKINNYVFIRNKYISNNNNIQKNRDYDLINMKKIIDIIKNTN
jgi:hypothetical protein